MLFSDVRFNSVAVGRSSFFVAGGGGEVLNGCYLVVATVHILINKGLWEKG